MKIHVLIFIFLTAPVIGTTQILDSLKAATEVDSLIQLNRALIGQRKFEEALRVIGEAENKAETAFGKNHPAYAACLHNHGRTFYNMGDHAQAEIYYTDALNLRQKVLGKEHPDYATTLMSLAKTYYYKLRQPQKAEPLYIEARNIRQKVLGKENPDYAWSTYDLANLYMDVGNFEQAESLFLEAQTIFKKTLGEKDPDYAWSLHSLGILYAKKGQYEKAEPLFLKAKNIREKVLDKTHPDYVASLQCLAIVNTDLSNYEKAEQLYLKSYDIILKNHGADHPYYSHVLNELAILYRLLGNYEKAEPYYLEVRDIAEKRLGREHPEYATILSNLANLYANLGQYGKAESLYTEANQIREKTVGKEHPDYAHSLSNLAILFINTNQYEKAEPLIIEANSIFEKALGKTHPDYAKSLRFLAYLYLNKRQIEKAETLFLEGKNIVAKALGEQHPAYAQMLQGLALLYWYSKEYAKTESLFIETENVLKKTLGKDHPECVDVLYKLAQLYWHTKEYEKAEQLFVEVNLARQKRIRTGMVFLSERELNEFSLKYLEDHHTLLSFGQRRTATTPSFSRNLYDNLLFHKGMLLNNARTLENAVAQTPDTLRDIHIRWKGYHRRLAAEYARPAADRSAEAIAELEEKANSLEKELVRSVAGFGNAMRQVRWQEVQAQLKPGEAAIEFVHYRYYNPYPTDSTMYAALVLRPGDDQPRFVALFEERSLDSLLQRHQDRRADYVNDLYTWSERGIDASGKPAKSLFELVWQPLEKELLPAQGMKPGSGIKTVYFSPSGLLHRFNLDAIPVNPDSVLADRYRLVELGSTRQLAMPYPGLIQEQNALLYGGIQYKMDSVAMVQAEASWQTEVASRDRSPLPPDDSLQRGNGWHFLHGSVREIDTIGQIMRTAGWPFDVRKGYEASEKSFKQIGTDKPSPRIIHVATHGFFFPDPKSEVRSEVLRSEVLSSEMSDPVFKISEHPMIRSGLLLAGANYAWNTGKPLQPGMEDGILTAYEISQMNLSGTELVVLSACETGLGDIQGNEGVYGLQRAFKIAGARYLLMSLWIVPDKETARLMAIFYKNWLVNKMPIPDAFKAAQKNMREAGFPPYSWAGFVLVE